MQTILATDKNYHYTTVAANNAGANLDILFQFAQPLITARLDYGSVIDENQFGGAGNPDPMVQLEVTAKGVTTLIYYHQAKQVNGQLDSYNYTAAGGIPNGVDGDSERSRAYTIIDDLVAGETEFTLNIEVYFGVHGDPAGALLVNMGGSFLPDREVPGYWPESDFFLTGIMEIPEPATMTLLALGAMALIRRKR